MSIPERIVRISKAYIHQVRDRIDSELSDAERELDTSHSSRLESASGESDADAMMQRAEERIAAARRDLEGRTELRGSADPMAAPSLGSSAAGTPSTAAAIVARSEDPNASNFRVLGVPVGSDLPSVTASYEKLARRCDPRRFPDGSPEQRDAEKILERINVSYEALRKFLDPTVNRFGKLEFE